MQAQLFIYGINYDKSVELTVYLNRGSGKTFAQINNSTLGI